MTYYTNVKQLQASGADLNPSSDSGPRVSLALAMRQRILARAYDSEVASSDEWRRCVVVDRRFDDKRCSWDERRSKETAIVHGVDSMRNWST